MNFDIKFLEEHDIPSQIVKTIWIARLSYFLDTIMCGFWYICILASSQTLVVNYQN